MFFKQFSSGPPETKTPLSIVREILIHGQLDQSAQNFPADLARLQTAFQDLTFLEPFPPLFESNPQDIQMFLQENQATHCLFTQDGAIMLAVLAGDTFNCYPVTVDTNNSPQRIYSVEFQDQAFSFHSLWELSSIMPKIVIDTCLSDDDEHLLLNTSDPATATSPLTPRTFEESSESDGFGTSKSRRMTKTTSASHFVFTGRFSEGGSADVHQAENAKKEKVAVRQSTHDTALEAEKERRSVKRIPSSLHLLKPTRTGVMDRDASTSVMVSNWGTCLDQMTYPMPLAQIRSILRDLLTGLATLHGHNMMHRDVKDRNVVLIEELAAHIDFDLICELVDVTARITVCGTPRVVAPEIVFMAEGTGNVVPGFGVDIWGIGCLAYLLASGSELMELDTRYSGEEPDYGFLASRFRSTDFLTARMVTCTNTVKGDPLHKQFSSFMSQVLKVDAKDRPSAADLLTHPFLDLEANS